jgi:hypothetical protein
MVEVVLKRLLPPISRRNKRFLLHKRQTRVALENGSPITTACRPLNDRPSEGVPYLRRGRSSDNGLTD